MIQIKKPKYEHDNYCICCRKSFEDAMEISFSHKDFNGSTNVTLCGKCREELRKALDKDTNVPIKSALDHIHNVVAENEYKRGYEQGKADAIPKWIPVTPDTMPEKNRVVVVCGEKGTWDYGTYRGHLDGINYWIWKKNTIKKVYWWMYKEDALPEPWKGEADE